jgi:hypothetical protein
MRILAGLMACGVLAGCAAYQTNASDPSISYRYADDDDYEEVAERADDYCDDHYDRDAILLDTDREDDGYEATFACR